MTSKYPPYEKTVQMFHSSEDPNEIIEGLIKLREWQTINTLPLFQRLEAQIPAFNNLRNLLNNDKVDEIESIILKYLLPDCLLFDEPSKQLISQHRDILGKWLDDLDDYGRNRIRSKAIDMVLPLLESSLPQTACWVISSIGYRDARIVRSLWKVVQNNDNEVGDIALSTLTWMGIPVSEKMIVLEELNSRAAKRFNTRLLWGIARLGDSSSSSVILEHWLSPQKRPELDVDSSLAFTALREIADANENNENLENFIWAECRKLVEQDPKTLYRKFDIGNVAAKCNSAEVIPTLLHWHGQHLEWFEQPDWARYLVQDHLKKCVKPKQLEGWKQINDQVIFEFLRQSACKNTKDDSFFTTQEWMEKDSAWKTLLRAGYEDALHWFDEAVANEEGRFNRKKIMDYLACFRIDPLPKNVIKWITEPYDDPGSGDGREISYRMAAVRIVRSTSTKAALETLLDFGFTYKGMIITASTDAVAEVAVTLIRQGNPTVVAHLVELFVNSSSYGQRLACISALEVIASFPENHQWLLPQIERLIPLVYDENREQVERGMLLNTLGYLNEWTVPDYLLQDLVSWAYKADRWIGGGSLHILAHHGSLDKYPNLMQDALGLEPDGGHWRLSSNKVPFEWAPYIIGQLYHINPDAYQPAVVYLLAQEWQAAVQIVRWLRATHGKEDQPIISQQIVEALIRRTNQLYSSFYGETEVFDILSELSPKALVEYTWGEAITKWIPDTRVALANALGKAKVEGEDQQACLSTLEILAEDSLYPVRRAAYRGLSKQSGNYLYSLCQSWLASPILKLNLRAAEACGWVENVEANNGMDGFEKIYQRCISHVEPKVRESVLRSWEEHRQRMWAKEYLEKIINVLGKDNLEILQTWCYGSALEQIGDDEIRDALIEHVSNSPLPPNVRFWIKSIIDELETNWKKTTQKWPDPWEDIRGAIEQGDGKLILEDNSEINIHYAIWQAPATTPREIHTWGGVIIAPFEHFIDLEKAIIEIKGHRRGNFILTGYSGDTGTILGTGAYPSLKPEND